MEIDSPLLVCVCVCICVYVCVRVRANIYLPSPPISKYGGWVGMVGGRMGGQMMGWSAGGGRGAWGGPTQTVYNIIYSYITL